MNKSDLPKQAPRSDDGAGANIDEVRELLFGTQIHDLESRFRLTEDRLLKETAEMRDDIRRRFDTLEQFIKKEVEALSGRHSSESAERKETVQRLAKDLKESGAEFTEKLAQLGQQSTAREHEVRQLVLDEAKKLTEEIRQKHEDVTTQLRHEAQELRSAKADRSTLATLLTDLAVRLNNGSPEKAARK